MDDIKLLIATVKNNFRVIFYNLLALRVFCLRVLAVRGCVPSLLFFWLRHPHGLLLEHLENVPLSTRTHGRTDSSWALSEFGCVKNNRQCVMGALISSNVN
jgi:hypothetical protein